MKNKMETLYLNVKGLEPYNTNTWYELQQTIKNISEGILSTEKDCLDIFKYEYVPVIKDNFDLIKQDTNKKYIIWVLKEIENNITDFLFINFWINWFYFWNIYFKKLIDHDNHESADDLYNFFNNTFLDNFYIFINNIFKFNIPLIKWDADNWVLFAYLNAWEIDFKYEYEVKENTRLESHIESEINLNMNLFDIKRSKNEFNKSEEELLNSREDIFKFIKLLTDNKDILFIWFWDKLKNDLKKIDDFLNKYWTYVDSYLEKSMYMKYFLLLSSYIKANSTYWSLNDFNKHLKNSIDELNFSEDELKAYKKLDTNLDFYAYLSGNFDLMIEDIINDIKWFKKI